MIRLHSPSILSRVEGLILNSYAKLNLYLEVLNKRKDKYHNIKTVFERIDLSDKIILKSHWNKEIKIVCNLPSIPKGNLNLTYRSAKLLQDSFNIDKGVEIKIIKRIPVASGLGGGSSNAACVLIGLNKLWRLNLNQNRLLVYAKKIGADVPFFVYNIPFAEGSSRGDKITPLVSLDNTRLWHVLIVPKIKVSTSFIYRRYDTLTFKTFKLTPHLWRYSEKNNKNEFNKGAGLTKLKYNIKMLTQALKEDDFNQAAKFMFNRLEEVTFQLYPKLRDIKEKLIQMGAKLVLMSGSGPAIFGIFSSRKEAVSVCMRLKSNGFGQVFTACTI